MLRTRGQTAFQYFFYTNLQKPWTQKPRSTSMANTSRIPYPVGHHCPQKINVCKHVFPSTQSQFIYSNAAWGNGYNVNLILIQVQKAYCQKHLCESHTHFIKLRVINTCRIKYSVRFNSLNKKTKQKNKQKKPDLLMTKMNKTFQQVVLPLVAYNLRKEQLQIRKDLCSV